MTVEPKDLIREVAILADRGDIAEEIVRLRAHLVQYIEVIARARKAPGRKLEFVVQEMGRETNTIGSKANDVEISRNVVEIKGLLERDPRAGSERGVTARLGVQEVDWAKLPGRLIVVSGPSGSGKSTLVQRLLARPDLRLELSVSATTRPPRPGELLRPPLCLSVCVESSRTCVVSFSNRPRCMATVTEHRPSRCARPWSRAPA